MKAILWMVAALVVACVYLWFFSPQFAAVMNARKVARQSPYVRMVPLALPDTSVSTAAGTRLRYCGYDFEIPWNDIDGQIPFAPNRVLVHFRSGHTLVFSCVPPLEFVHAALEGKTRDTFRQIYGETPLESDYALQRLVLESTPDKVTLFSSRKEAVGAPMLLLMKAVSAPEQSGLFTIQTKDFKGFQWGDPQKRPINVYADLYTNEGSLEFNFIQPKAKASGMLTQAEVNRVLQSATKSAQADATNGQNGPRAETLEFMADPVTSAAKKGQHSK